jgi:hypothetical protein
VSAKKITLSERNIQVSLYWELQSSCAIIMPNFTPTNWWECDLFAVTKAGYMREYEIKLTVSDFKADARKAAKRLEHQPTMKDGLWQRAAYKQEHKHGLLSSGDVRGPSQFWYVVSKGLVSAEDVPSWAGLIEAEVHEGWYRPHLVEVKKAPRLHKAKINDGECARATTNGHLRYWHLLNDGTSNEFDRLPGTLV